MAEVTLKHLEPVRLLPVCGLESTFQAAVAFKSVLALTFCQTHPLPHVRAQFPRGPESCGQLSEARYCFYFQGIRYYSFG